LDALPPDLRTRNWSAPDLPALLHAHLKKNPPPIGSLLAEQDREYLLESSWQQAELPPVLTSALAAIPHRTLGQMDESSQARFVGRADLLNQLHQLLWLRHMGEPSSVALTAALYGAGGFGKSRLAAEYVHRYAPSCFKGGIFWMHCETELESQFHEAAQALDPATPPIQVLRQNQVNIPQLLRDKVQAVVSQGKPVLFVLDNVPEVAGKLLPLDKYCPARGLAAVLITSRQRQAAVETIDVDALTPEAAWLILAADLPRRSELSRKFCWRPWRSCRRRCVRNCADIRLSPAWLGMEYSARCTACWRVSCARNRGWPERRWRSSISARSERSMRQRCGRSRTFSGTSRIFGILGIGLC
jgi:hypothetical protein